eukprot:1366792-Amorphochlora_amoeboformis.AAC.1
MHCDFRARAYVPIRWILCLVYCYASKSLPPFSPSLPSLALSVPLLERCAGWGNFGCRNARDVTFSSPRLNEVVNTLVGLGWSSHADMKEDMVDELMHK